MPRQEDHAKSKWHSPALRIVTSRKGAEGRIPVLYDEARGLYLPQRFETEFRIKNQPVVILEHRAFPWQQGMPVIPVCVRVEIKASDEGPGIPATLRPPLAKYMRYAVAAAAARLETFEFRRPGPFQPWTTSETFTELLDRRPGRPTLEQTLDLARVADIYRSGGRKGLKALTGQWVGENGWGISQRTAARYARRARDAGLL